jgi:single-stranded-DNA-specific exonuclease
MPVDAAFYPQINVFRGNRTLQLLIVDLRRSMTPLQLQQRIYQRYRQGKALEADELAQLLPERRDFVVLWRYLERQSTVETSPAILLERLCAATGVHQPYGRMMICLEVLQERGLLEIAGSERLLRLSLHRQHSKVDLNASEVLVRLRRQMETR